MSLFITQAAAKFILRFLEEENKRGQKKEQPLRLAVKRGSGCGDIVPHLVPNAGFIPGEDERIEAFGLTVICNLAMIPELEGVTIDLHSELGNSHIVYLSPHLNACGCGKAVTKK